MGVSCLSCHMVLAADHVRKREEGGVACVCGAIISDFKCVSGHLKEKGQQQGN